MRQAAAEHDHVGVEHVDHRARGRAPAGPRSEPASPRPPDRRAPPLDDALGAFQARRLWRVVVGGEPGPREVASRCSRCGRSSRRAPAARRPRPRQRVVPPLAGDRVRAGEDAAVHDDAAADAGARGSRRRPRARRPPRRRSPPRARSSWRRSRSARAAPRRADRSRSSGWPLSHVEFAFLTRPVAGEIAPGMPTPTLPR